MFYRIAISLVLLTGCAGAAQAQPCRARDTVIATRAAWQDTGRNKIVRLRSFIPGIATDMRYASPGNFTHTTLYASNADAYMHIIPAQALARVQQDLKKQGLGLKIYDAYRPFSITCRIWRLVPDRRYAANPRNGSHHNRAIAVDLTLIDLRTGKELDMGTGFDNFTDSAHHDFAALPPQVLQNRRLLRSVMTRHGFNAVPTEWWHYHWHDKKYDLLDLSFADMQVLAVGR